MRPALSPHPLLFSHLQSALDVVPAWVLVSVYPDRPGHDQYIFECTGCEYERGHRSHQNLRTPATADVVELARQYGRYGYRKIAALLRQAGWSR